MLTVKSVTVETPICICDRCACHMEKDSPDGEWYERLILSFRAGYGSIFGDGNFVEGDFCQACIQELLGQWLRITQDDPFDPQYQPSGVARKLYHDYQFDPTIQAPGRMVNLAQLKKNLDDLNQMRATLAERLGVSENLIEMMALKYLLHATESMAIVK